MKGVVEPIVITGIVFAIVVEGGFRIGAFAGRIDHGGGLLCCRNAPVMDSVLGALCQNVRALGLGFLLLPDQTATAWAADATTVSVLALMLWIDGLGVVLLVFFFFRYVILDTGTAVIVFRLFKGKERKQECWC